MQYTGITVGWDGGLIRTIRGKTKYINTSLLVYNIEKIEN